ncbi:hypothetical protein JFL43_01705 [Viridibacillus sp. YIM B01967]|uniref:Uncharacterized protein n=1 Tax=Viridibacillus soli TaxID=2798301 RepID=A0ABS1H2R5_9BACL|nr:hypothetical protein [Viridibacillus soli]MBK3493604.1 hypothetical protein [Viridibacillus soli]
MKLSKIIMTMVISLVFLIPTTNVFASDNNDDKEIPSYAPGWQKVDTQPIYLTANKNSSTGAITSVDGGNFKLEVTALNKSDFFSATMYVNGAWADQQGTSFSGNKLKLEFNGLGIPKGAWIYFEVYSTVTGGFTLDFYD